MICINAICKNFSRQCTVIRKYIRQIFFVIYLLFHSQKFSTIKAFHYTLAYLIEIYYISKINLCMDTTAMQNFHPQCIVTDTYRITCASHKPVALRPLICTYNKLKLASKYVATYVCYNLLGLLAIMPKNYHLYIFLSAYIKCLNCSYILTIV